MGIDVNMYATGTVTDEQFAEAVAYLELHLGKPEYGDAWIEHDRDEGRIYFQSMDRYYGPGYERGYWPSIYSEILALRTALPGCSVHYGSDTSDDADEIDDAELARIWEHWLGPHGQDYRRHL